MEYKRIILLLELKSGLNLKISIKYSRHRQNSSKYGFGRCPPLFFRKVIKVGIRGRKSLPRQFEKSIPNSEKVIFYLLILPQFHMTIPVLFQQTYFHTASFFSVFSIQYNKSLSISDINLDGSFFIPKKLTSSELDKYKPF